MDIKKMFDKLNTMSDTDIMIAVSAAINYLVKARECDFKKIIKELKKCNKYINKKGVI